LYDSVPYPGLAFLQTHPTGSLSWPSVWHESVAVERCAS